MKQHYFISIEGAEGMGKTTVFRAIDAYLTRVGIDHLMTREPGGTPIAERIREVLLAHDHETLTPMSELFLMFASRSQHIEHVIKPALAAKQWVICDRFVDASFAYQGGGRELGFEKLSTMSRWVVDRMPDVTFLLDGPVDLGLARISGRHMIDRIEVEGKAFFERVRQAYLARAAAEPDRFIVIDASMPRQQVIASVIQRIESMHHG